MLCYIFNVVGAEALFNDLIRHLFQSVNFNRFEILHDLAEEIEIKSLMHHVRESPAHLCEGFSRLISQKMCC